MTKYKCSVCGKELSYKADKCGDYAKKRIKEDFRRKSGFETGI